MKTVIYTCSFVPCEWIAAHGLRPKRISPRTNGADALGPIAGLCEFARALVNSSCSQRDADAIVVTTVCDQMRHAPDLIAEVSDLPIFVMTVPSTWQSSAARQLYINELTRLGEFCIRLGGEAPSKAHLVRVMLEYEAARRKLQQSRGSLSGRQYAEAVRSIPQGEPISPAGSRATSSANLVSLALLGGELLADDLVVSDVVEQLGAEIALDATDTGDRSLPGLFDPREVQSEPLAELAKAYFGTIPDAFRRPNTCLYDYLETQLAERDIQGIVFRRCRWCDIWNAELQRLRDWASVPILDLDIGCEGNDLIRLTGRLEAFVETLR